MGSMPDDTISKAVADMVTGMYGPRFCANCQKVQPVRTYKLEGSDFSRLEGTTYTAGFTGAHVCDICLHTVKD